MRKWTARSEDDNYERDFCVLKVEPTGYPGKYNVRCKKKKDCHEFRVLGLINGKHWFAMKLDMQEYKMNNFEGSED